MRGVAIDRWIDRYYGRGYGYYWLREFGLSTFLLACVVATGVMLDYWWLWALVLVLNVPTYVWAQVAGWRAWRSLQRAGASREELCATLRRLLAANPPSCDTSD